MRVVWNWLARYVDLKGLDPQEIAERFSASTAEIEAVHLPPSVAVLRQFRCVWVEKVEKHPKADRLSCCVVRDGDQRLEIVCGAPNVRAGLKTILAPLGSRVGTLLIEECELRGQRSQGMLCSEMELGLGTEHGGIVELDTAVELGTTADIIFSGRSVVWELDNKAITHRPDLWGHHGIARELAALLKRELKNPELAELDGSAGDDGFSIKIDNPEDCRRYCGLSLSNVKVGPSPEWMRGLLLDAGFRPINHVVDVTNFVMLELGHPNHAFDVRKLPGRDIRIMRAGTKEKFSTLTGKELELGEGDLVIRAGGEVTALAGVVGGENSSIAEETSDIFLEAAHFEPLRVRKSAASHDIRTDSSARFEKSLDPENAPRALCRMVQLLKEISPELKQRSRLLDAFPRPYAPLKLVLRTRRAADTLGMEIDAGEQADILGRLGFGVVTCGDTLEVNVPSYRATKDIEQEIDLVEELGRIAGFERVGVKSPRLGIEPVQMNPRVARARAIRDSLASLGYDEVLTHSFAREELVKALGARVEDCVELANPLGRDQSLLRPSILTHVEEIWALNLKQFESFAMFELGTVFHRTEQKLPLEFEELMLCRYGPGNGVESLLRLRDDLLTLSRRMTWQPFKVVQSSKDHPLAHPARCAVIEQAGAEIGTMAELHPAVARRIGIPRSHRLNFSVLKKPLGLAELPPVQFAALAKFPEVPFSISLLVPERTTAGEVMDLVQAVSHDQIVQLRYKDCYVGPQIPEGQKSLTFSMRFRHLQRTLTGEEIGVLQARIVEAAARREFLLRES